jgi:hypothetical protein
MEIVREKKNIDYSKINIGTELECFIIERDSFANISREQSQKVFKTLIKKYGWSGKKIFGLNEIQRIEKSFFNQPIKIVFDTSYSLFEIVIINPVSSLEVLEKLHKGSLFDLRQALNEHDFIIWPFGVLPASTGLFRLPQKTREEIVNDRFYDAIREICCISRFSHMASHQANIDIPFSKMLPAINAFFKNSAKIFEKFANSAAFFNQKLYKEGRYYWWKDAYPQLRDSKRGFYTHEFPPKEYTTWNDLLKWLFKHNLYIFRNNDTYVPTEKYFNFHKFLRKGKARFKNKDGKIIETNVTKEDLENFFLQINIELSPHFDLKSDCTIEDFLKYYRDKDLDSFFSKYVQHSWLEFRQCSTHFEENAMSVPRYFYDIVINLDKYIKDSKKISWKEAKIARDKAIGYTK